MEPFSVLHSRYGGLEERIARGGGGRHRPAAADGVAGGLGQQPGPAEGRVERLDERDLGGVRQCRTAGFREGGSGRIVSFRKGGSSNAALNASESEAPKHCRFRKRGTEALSLRKARHRYPSDSGAKLLSGRAAHPGLAVGLAVLHGVRGAILPHWRRRGARRRRLQHHRGGALRGRQRGG